MSEVPLYTLQGFRAFKPYPCPPLPEAGPFVPRRAICQEAGLSQAFFMFQKNFPRPFFYNALHFFWVRGLLPSLPAAVLSGKVPREQMMLTGHLPRVIYQQVY